MSAVRTNHGRRARRTIKVALAPAWIEFDSAAQVAQLRRTVTKDSKKTVEVVYLITSDRSAGPATLAAWVRSRWEIESKLHWVRDVTYQEDKSLVRIGNAPRMVASLRSLAISLLRLDGHTNLASANRHHARGPQRTLKPLETTARLCWLPAMPAYHAILSKQGIGQSPVKSDKPGVWGPFRRASRQW